MNIIERSLLRLSWTLILFVVLLSIVWGGTTLLRIISPEVYSDTRDWARVLRTKHLRPNHKYRFLEIHPEYGKIDANAILRVRTVHEIRQAREALTRVIWSNGKFPNELYPTTVKEKIQDPIFSKLETRVSSGSSEKVALVENINELVHQTYPGFVSKAYHIVPTRRNGSLVIYHEGNTGSFHRSAHVLQAFLEEGFEVLAFSMWIIDHKPIVEVSGAGSLQIIGHSFLQFIDDPLRVYIDPLVAGLNKLATEREYEQIIAVGFSGGGWVITVLAALDPRIQLSYPVAGSYPLYLRRFRNWSTWQETWPPLISATNYLDLYVMATDGPGRRQVQVLNQFDGCCYSGLDWQTYAEVVRSAAKKVGGGGWNIFVDITHADHRLSEVGLRAILDDINASSVQ